MPSLSVDGAVTPILHVSQIATALGLPVPAAVESTRLGWELAATLDAWLELLPAAWETGRFDWDPDGDGEREAVLRTPGEVAGFAGRIAAGWTSFLLDSEAALAERDPAVVPPRGTVTYSELLASQAWHARFHLDQVEAFLAGGPGADGA